MQVMQSSVALLGTDPVPTFNRGGVDGRYTMDFLRNGGHWRTIVTLTSVLSAEVYRAELILG